MGKCRSSQEVLTDYILHEKWTEAVAAWLVEACDEYKTSRKVNAQKGAEFFSEATRRKYRFKTERLQVLSASKACSRAKERYCDDPAFEAFLEFLQRASGVKTSSWFRPMDDSR